MIKIRFVKGVDNSLLYHETRNRSAFWVANKKRVYESDKQGIPIKDGKIATFVYGHPGNKPGLEWIRKIKPENLDVASAQRKRI